MNYKIANKRLINGPLTINYDILQRLSFEVDLNNEEALEGLYIAAGLQLHAPGSSLLFYSSDAEYASGVLSFNVNTYTENFLNNVTKIGTKAYLEIAQMQDNYKEVLLFDDIIVEPRVYSEGMTPEPIDPSEWATRSWVLGNFEPKITEDRKISYYLISGAPEVGSGTIILTQGGVEKGRFNVNQSGDFSIDFDLGPEGSVTSSWVDANYEKKITSSNKLSYSLLSGTPTIPTKTSDLTNDSGFTTQAWVNLQLLSYQKQITVNSKLDYSLLSGTPTIPTVNDSTITLRQGGVIKGSFTLNQSNGAIIDFDAGGGGDITSGWVDANYQKIITSDRKLDYSLLSGTPAIPTVGSGTINIKQGGVSKGSFNVNQSTDLDINIDESDVTSSWVDINYEKKITSDRKLSYSLLSGTPTIGSAVITLVQGGISKGSFNVNQTSNASITLDVGVTSSWVDSNYNKKITSSNKLSYSLLSGTPTIPEVGSGTITLKQGGNTKGTFNVNQSADLEINFDAGGGSALKEYVVTTSSLLCADYSCDYLWGLLDTGAAYFYAPSTDYYHSYNFNVDFNLSGTVSVYFNNCSIRGQLYANCLNRCTVVGNYKGNVVYVYDILSALPMTRSQYGIWTQEGHDSAAYPLADGVYVWDTDNSRYTNTTHMGWIIEQAGTNWRLLTNTGEYFEEIAMGPESEASPFGTYGSVYNPELNLDGDSLFTFSAETLIQGSII